MESDGLTYYKKAIATVTDWRCATSYKNGGEPEREMDLSSG